MDVERLKELLIEEGLNYSDLAEKAEISKTQVYRIVNKSNPKIQIKTISALSKALGVSYKELYVSDEKGE